MLQTTQMILAALAGAIASLLYFGGLWLTVKRLADASNPAAVYIGSFLARASLLTCGALAMLQLEPGWQEGLAAFVGFWGVRCAMTLSLGVRKITSDPVHVSQP